MASSSNNISIDGLVGTILFHALLLILFLFLYLPKGDEILQEEGILINFGTAIQGEAEIQPVTEEAQASEAQQMETVAPNSEANQQQPEPIAEAEVETAPTDAPALPPKEVEKDKDTEKDKDKDKEQENTQNEQTNNQETAETDNTANDSSNTPEIEEPEEPKINENSLFPGGISNDATGQGTGGDSNSDMGDVMGSVDISDNTGDTSPGLGDSGIGFNLTGRRLVVRPNISDNSQEVGTVVIRIKVDNRGNVIDAQYTSAGSTTSSQTLVAKAIKAAKSAKFNADLDAAAVQSGTMTFKFKVK